MGPGMMLKMFGAEQVTNASNNEQGSPDLTGMVNSIAPKPSAAQPGGFAPMM